MNILRTAIYNNLNLHIEDKQIKIDLERGQQLIAVTRTHSWWKKDASGRMVQISRETAEAELMAVNGLEQLPEDTHADEIADAENNHGQGSDETWSEMAGPQ